MNLHRASTKPDWENIPSTQRTYVQRIAAASNGVLTPPNLITVIGLVLVLWGIGLIWREEFIIGTLLLAIGRALDVVDGWVAEATRTKSPLGEMSDAVVDKIGTLLTIIVLFVANIAPWWVIAGLLLPQLIIPLIIAYKKRRGISVHPTRQGKLSMAIAWMGIVGLLIVAGLPDAGWLAVIAYGCVGVSLVLGAWAAGQYARWNS